MDTDGALVIDMRRPDWAGSAENYLAAFSPEPPKSMCFEVPEGAEPSTEEAQLILALTKFAEAVDTPVSIDGPLEDLVAGLAKSGLSSVFPAEGDNAP